MRIGDAATPPNAAPIRRCPFRLSGMLWAALLVAAPSAFPDDLDPREEIALPAIAVASPAGSRGSFLDSAPLAADSEQPAGIDLPLDRRSEPIRPSILEPRLPAEDLDLGTPQEFFVQTQFHPPLGFTGPSGILPDYVEENNHFIPAEDRWRSGFPYWDRYNLGFPVGVDYPYRVGRWWDPYNQNVLKGDYALIGQHTFFRIDMQSVTLLEVRQVPTGTTPFESMAEAGHEDFFQNPNQFFYNQYFRMGLTLFHGDAAFKPVDWQIKLGPVFNVNHLDVEELAVVSPDVRKGTTRSRTWMTLEEWFVEAKLADLSADYDFVSVRAGSQFFLSDFRGFLFADTNRSVRLFGNRLSNRDQFNVIFFDQTDKDINSALNTFRDRHQNTLIANYYRQDFVFPGYTAEASVHYNWDQPSFRFDANRFLARPDPTGVFTPHEVHACYLGFAGNGHIGRYNISNAFYWAVGHDSLNPLAGREQDINAQMAALEISYDRDWIRFRASAFWASGDDDINDSQARGFDTIFDNPAFVGGEFSYWNRQQIGLLGVNLVQRNSLVPDLRSSKFQGQSNFVNPGIFIANVGADYELTPKLRLIQNLNYLRFDENDVLEQFLFQDNINRSIGFDLSLGMEYRPLLNNNSIILAGISMLLPGEGFKDIYDTFVGDVDPLLAGFVELVLAY